MIVHLGVILIAVALVASNSYTTSAELELRQGEPVEWDGHTFEYVEVVNETTTGSTSYPPTCCSTAKVYGPALTTYLADGRRSARRA
jgi:cytochrome c-type biogenesis protein CcmF